MVIDKISINQLFNQLLFLARCNILAICMLKIYKISTSFFLQLFIALLLQELYLVFR